MINKELWKGVVTRVCEIKEGVCIIEYHPHFTQWSNLKQ